MRLAIRQSKLPACLAEVQLALKILSSINATGLVKLTDKMDKISINGKFKVQEPMNGEFFAYMWVTLLYFSKESRLDSSSVGIRSSQFVLKISYVKNLTDVTQLSNRSLRVFSEQFSIKIVTYEDEMLILGQNDILCGYSVVNFSVWFLQLTVFEYLVASHVTELGSLLTEPGAVIKFSHFSSHPGTCML